MLVSTFAASGRETKHTQEFPTSLKFVCDHNSLLVTWIEFCYIAFLTKKIRVRLLVKKMKVQIIDFKDLFGRPVKSFHKREQSLASTQCAELPTRGEGANIMETGRRVTYEVCNRDRRCTPLQIFFRQDFERCFDNDFSSFRIPNG